MEKLCREVLDIKQGDSDNAGCDYLVYIILLTDVNGLFGLVC